MSIYVILEIKRQLLNLLRCIKDFSAFVENHCNHNRDAFHAVTRQTKSLCKSATICKSRFSPERPISRAEDECSFTSAFCSLAASRSRTMPVSLPIVQLLLFFVYPFFFGQRIRLFLWEHVEFPAKRGRKEACAAGENCQTVVTSASVCRWLMTVIFRRIRWPAVGTRLTLSVVYKRYCRCTATLRSFPTRFYSINHSHQQETHRHCKIRADLRFSAKSFFARQVYITMVLFRK